MKVLLINVVCGIRSTGRICGELADRFRAEGHEAVIAYGRESVPDAYANIAVRIGTDWDHRIHAVATRLLDAHGFASRRATRDFLRWADTFDPDLLWLHNIHGYYLHIEELFRWIKSRPRMEVRWTLHDCWAFTGHCVHFVAADCSRWKTGCHHCPLKREYPKSLLCDRSAVNYARKKAAFCGVKNMTLITPSQWLAGLVRQSFLGEYPVEVVYNRIDQSVFRPTDSDFRQRYGLQDRQIILGVASTWSREKGLYDFYELAKLLNARGKIVLVGLTEAQCREVPPEILAIQRTNSPQELAEIYSAADVFFNPTYQDTYPTVNLEAEACGTRVITYATGGAPETIHRADSVVIPVGEYQTVLEYLTL